MKPLAEAEIYMQVLGNTLPSLMQIKFVDRLNKKEHLLKIGRYAPWTGFIELFFMHPQEEWVELSGLDNFNYSIEGSIDSSVLEEKIKVKKDLSERYLIVDVKRKVGEEIEEGLYFETWKNAPKIRARWVSRHSNGYLITEINKELLNETKYKNYIRFIEASKSRVKRTYNEIQIWKKNFEIFGRLPKWKDSLRPIKSNPAQGYSIEVGFIYIQGHGDWYKYLEYDTGEKFLIIEEGFTWDKFTFQGKETYGKRSYSMYLFKVKSLDEATDILCSF